MLAAIGDLIDDIVVRPEGPIRHATDTSAQIVHRQGGSAANVCVTAARLGQPSRLLAQVGDDRTGRGLVDELAAIGVDVSRVRYAGSTGSIVVLVDVDGERTMIVDRRSALELAHPEPDWLDGVDVLHVPLYSLAEGPIVETARTLIAEAHRRQIAVSIDVSSVAVIEQLGVEHVRVLLDELDPHVIFANQDEAAALGGDGSIAAITVIKLGARPALVTHPGGERVEVPAESVRSVVDTTGAGDAFAAGFLGHRSWKTNPVDACRAGHGAAADLLRRRTIC